MSEVEQTVLEGVSSIFKMLEEKKEKEEIMSDNMKSILGLLSQNKKISKEVNVPFAFKFFSYLPNKGLIASDEFNVEISDKMQEEDQIHREKMLKEYEDKLN